MQVLKTSWRTYLRSKEKRWTRWNLQKIFPSSLNYLRCRVWLILFLLNSLWRTCIIAHDLQSHVDVVIAYCHSQLFLGYGHMLFVCIIFFSYFSFHSMEMHLQDAEIIICQSSEIIICQSPVNSSIWLFHF